MLNALAAIVVTAETFEPASFSTGTLQPTPQQNRIGAEMPCPLPEAFVYWAVSLFSHSASCSLYDSENTHTPMLSLSSSLVI